MIVNIKSHLVNTGEEISLGVTVSDGMIQRVFSAIPIPKGKSLDRIVLPSCCKEGTITSIGRDAFMPNICGTLQRVATKENSVKEIVIPDSITKVESEAFFMTCADKLIWSRNCRTVPENCFSGSSISEFANFENVVSIRSGAFENCKNLKRFHWPHQAIRIPNRCFSGCSALSELKGIEDVEYIGISAFEMTNLNELVWPERCDSLQGYCFMGCKSLKNVDFPGNITKLEANAFCNTGVRNINLTNSFLCDVSGKEILEGLNVNVIYPYYQSF